MSSRHTGKLVVFLLLIVVQVQVWRTFSAPSAPTPTVHLPSRSDASSTLPLARALERARKGHVGTTGHPHGRKKQVVVASSFGAHDDVYWSSVDTLERLLPPSNIQVYGRQPRYRIHKDVFPPLGINPSGIYRDSEDFLSGVSSGWGDDVDGGADMVVLGTCEIDMAEWSDALFRIWLARPDDRKFDLICIVHNSNDAGWAETYSADWVRVGALRIMPIAAHVTKAWQARLALLADEPGRFHLGYGLVPVMEHIPVYSIERLHLNAPALSEDDDDDSELPPSFSMGGEDLFISGKGGVQVSRTGRKDGRVLRDAVIQGNFETARRAYDVVLADLEAEIKADPTFWGYHISHSGVFVPTSPDAFILHLIGGNGKDLDKIMPPSLQHAVQVHSQLSYLDFFAFLGRVDVVLPSFTEGGKYCVSQASSTVAMAAQCGVPLLATERIRNAYTYLTDDATIVRPQLLGEISALKALRGGKPHPPARPYSHDFERTWTQPEASWPSAGEHAQEANLALKAETETMLASGWVRGDEGWTRFKKGLREQNEEVLRLFLWG